MKYPQLVPTRAVNAISDWLVSRLEQLGVEAPQIYSRLLLSLLQSSVQINDPIELSNLETFFANRKGSNRRYHPCEPSTLKKINAVQCLREIVSSEQEISTIEVLVDELFEKLIAIEKQSTDVEDDQSLLATLSVDTNKLDSSLNQPHTFQKHHKGLKEGEILKGGCFVFGSNISKTIRGKAESRSKQKELSDNESDPKKRYFRAFPALTKEIEDSFRILKRNTKSLTWPVDKCKINKSSILYKDLNLHLEVKSMNVKQIGQQNTAGVGIIENEQEEAVHNSNNGNAIATVVKRKTRRRRHQGLSRVNNRRNACGNGKRRSSPPVWDTDFEGCWEMGRDLIKEFIMKQNNRNRSTSETAVHTDKKQKRKQLKDPEILQVEQQSNKPAIDFGRYSPLISPLDISFCYNMDDDDTLASVSEITEVPPSPTHEFVSEPVSSDCFDVEQFKAKFDSSLEALWKNIPDDTGYVNARNGSGTHSISSSIMQLTSLPSAPLKNNLQNLCSNFIDHRSYNHGFDLEKIPQESQSNGDNPHNLCCSGFGKDVTNTSDYYSMPYNWKQFDKSNDLSSDVPFNVFLQNSIWSGGSHGIAAANTEENSYKQGWNSLQKSNQFEAISAQLEETEPCSQENAFKLPFKYGQSKWSEGINAGPNATTFSIQPASPFLHVQLTSASSSSSIISSCSVDHVKYLGEIGAATALNSDQNTIDSASTTSCSSYSTHYNWQTPLLGRSLQPDMQSWSSSNPISLTEMYGTCGGTNDAKRVTGRLYVKPSINETVTLTNHCSSSSSFIEYARIKLSSVKASKHDNAIIKTVASHQSQQFPPIRTKECYVQDEDLLHSDLTHFRPIKPYEDGHSFYICSALDVVEYERSESGYLYWESEKYLEYTRKDCFLAEEDQNAFLHSSAPLYATSYSEENSANSSCNRQCNFVMKFRLKNCDAACQTEDKSTTETSMPFIIKEHPLRSIFSTSLQSMQCQSNSLACNDAIKALSKAVVAAAKVAATRNTFDDRHWLPHVACYHSVTLPSKTKELMEATTSNEGDFQTSKTSNALQQWSMHEIGKKCDLNNENNAADAHTLWGMCATCNNEFKSIPANSLLKDELHLEADEIMSDLKYMQDLYIDESKWDTEETKAKNIDLVSSRKLVPLDDSNRSHISEIRDIHPEEKELYLQQQNRATQNVFKKVNRLIADLLCRDNCKSPSNYAVSKEVQFLGSLRSKNDENNIWQQDSVDCTPIDFLKRLNNGQRNRTALRTEEDNFLAKLSWEHDYLAEIWEKRTPPVDQRSNEIFNIGEPSEIIRQNLKNVSNVPVSPLLRIGENFMATCSKQKGSNRKRRHSASQNIYLTLPSNNVSKNNNDLHIADLNQFDIKTEICNSKGKQNSINYIASAQTYHNNSNFNTEEAANMSQPKQTIITCKYWTIDPSASPTTPDILESSAFSCLLNKNASILKHVTMVTRPLTR